MALHLAYVDETKAKSEAQLAIGNSYGLMNVKSDLAELQHITPIATYESPLYILKGWDDICMGATLDSYMNGYQDPRLSAYFEAGYKTNVSRNIGKEVIRSCYLFIYFFPGLLLVLIGFHGQPFPHPTGNHFPEKD